jgi:hypothetical protein
VRRQPWAELTPIQATPGTAQHIAVATRQKSTARRLVSSCWFRGDTSQMLFIRDASVTTQLAATATIFP